MIYWAPLLHFYQPPTQFHRVLKKVCDESYRPLIKLFHELPGAKVTVNISASLTELLQQHEMLDVIDGLRDLAEKSQVEFVGSAKYHPILPLIPREEVLRQITLNYETNRQAFGDIYSPEGFFPPEMAYSRDIVKPILDSGHKWLILSGVACPAAWPMDLVYEIQSNNQSLAVFFRDDIVSNEISFRRLNAPDFPNRLKQLQDKKRDIYVVTAMDAETFGHHIKNWEKLFLREVYKNIKTAETEEPGSKQRQTGKRTQISDPPGKSKRPQIRVVTMSQLLKLFPTGVSIEPRSSSWSTSIDDIKTGNNYPLWKSKNNIVHQMLWQHLQIAINLTKKATEAITAESSKNFTGIARENLDKALHSDQFWWANQTPMWDINLIDRGLVMQRSVIINAYKAIKISKTSDHEKTEFYYQVLAANDLENKITEQLLMR